MAPLLEQSNNGGDASRLNEPNNRACVPGDSITHQFVGRCRQGRQSWKTHLNLGRFSWKESLRILRKHQRTLNVDLPFARLQTVLTNLDAVTVTPKHFWISVDELVPL